MLIKLIHLKQKIIVLKIIFQGLYFFFILNRLKQNSNLTILLYLIYIRSG